MSIARHHSEWLSLVEVSGPFLSMPVLTRVFPQGLDAHDSEKAGRLRQVFQEWDEDRISENPDRAIHWAWIKFVLTELLEFEEDLLLEGQSIPPSAQAKIEVHNETLRPDFVIKSPEGDKLELLIRCLPSSQGLEKTLAGSSWKVSPATRMMELLHATNTPLGLVTNGERWMLVYAPRGETSGFISWYASLWSEEPLTFRAFCTFLSAYRFFGVAESETLHALIEESSKDQQEVTDQLGFQVRKAVEVLVQSLDNVDKEKDRTLLTGIKETDLYQAALTVMMRLVFLLSAEERGLFQLGESLYDQNYAISTLRDQLRDAADKFGEEVLERRHDAWGRLLATFRAVFGGVSHEALRLPAYGGSLFDPDRFPFLEGRKIGTNWQTDFAKAIPLHNRTVLHLLESLQILQVRVPGGGPAEARRLSFRALDIEQIGHVYEGLLDHTAIRAKEPILGLSGAKGIEPEISLPALEEKKDLGTNELVGFLFKETKRSKKALEKAFSELELGDEVRLRTVCDNNDELLDRVRPFASLLRNDTFGYPVVIPTGSVYVTKGSDRRTTGTHYTPRSLTESIVQHALDPQVYEGMADGIQPSPDTLKSSTDILELKVCDFACGSGAFLVQACRYLSEKLVESWEKAEKDNPETTLIIPDGDSAEGRLLERLLPKDAEERLALARRLVADRCLYGVDVNPMAVEMAKLSIWLVTLQKNRPFTFLDHAIKCGDSLLGLTSTDQIINFHLDPAKGRKIHRNILNTSTACQKSLQIAVDKRKELESFPVTDIRDAEHKATLHCEAEEATNLVRLLGNLVSGAGISTAEVSAKFNPSKSHYHT